MKLQATGVVALAGLMISGCVTANFTKPVGDFTTGMAAANAAVQVYYAELDDYERRLYLDSAFYDPTKPIGAIDADGRRTPLLGVFSADSVRARLDALSLLTVYGERLAALAGSDAPIRFNTGSQTLGTNLSSLSQTFRDLSESGADPGAASYVTPIAALVGLAGELYLSRQRDEALAQAVQQGAPAVEQILDMLERDMEQVALPLRTTGELQVIALSVEEYNRGAACETSVRGWSAPAPQPDRSDCLTPERRRVLLDLINARTSTYRAMKSARPGEVIDAVRDAHAALVVYARSSRKPEDLSAVVAAIEAFNRRLEPVLTAIHAMKEQ